MQRISNTVSNAGISNTGISNSWTDRLVLIAALCSALAVPLALTGCNTTEGVGEDISEAGEALDDAAEDAN